MKRLGALISLSLLIVLLATSFCFADGLEITDTYPRDGYENAAIENFGVKLYFNQDIINAENEAANKKCFVIRDAEGKKVPSVVVYSPKEKGLVMVLADLKDPNTKITESTKYTLTISEDFTAASGDTLGKDVKINLTTLNQSRAMMVNMALMGVMFVAILVFSSRSMKKEAAKKKAEEKVNPYKVARETGKSVEEIIEQEQRKKERRAAAQARKYASYSDDDDDDDDDDDYDNGNKRVKGPRPISEGGSTYITGRKAIAEKKAAEALARGTTKPKKAGKKKKK